MRHPQVVLLGIVVAAFTVAVTAQTDVTGTWDMMFNLESGPAPATMTAPNTIGSDARPTCKPRRISSAVQSGFFQAVTPELPACPALWIEGVS